MAMEDAHRQKKKITKFLKDIDTLKQKQMTGDALEAHQKGKSQLAWARCR